MLLMLIGVLVQVAIVVGVAMLVVRAVVKRGPASGEQRAPGGGGARRLLTYILSFAGLMFILYAAAGLLAVGVATPLLRSSTLISADDVRTRASFYLAALIVGAPLWWFTWRAAQRAALAREDERTAPERRLFLAALFAVTAVVVVFSAQTLLQYVLTLPGPAAEQGSAVDGIAAAARLAVYGLAWLLCARFVRREVLALGGQARGDAAPGPLPSGVGDQAYDLAVYVVEGCALVFLGIGGFQAVQRIARDLVTATQPLLVGASGPSVWAVWGTIASWLLAGGTIWTAMWLYDRRRGGARAWRVLYLNIVVLLAAPVALGGAINLFYEVLRRAFGAQGGLSDLAYLPDTLPYLLVGGIIWAGHWWVIRQLRPAGYGLSADEAPGGVPWPRRPALTLLTLAGLAVATPALISIIWLVLDLAFNPQAPLSGPDWWRDRLALSLAAGLVGLVAWLGTWNRLQRAAEAAPQLERGAQERRMLVGAVVVLSLLVGAGFLVALLWLILQALLGAPGDATTASRALKDLSTVIVLGGLAVWYGTVLRTDLRLGVAHRTVRAVILVAPGAAAALTALRRQAGLRTDVAGYLAGEPHTVGGDPAELAALLSALGQSPAQPESALVVLRPDGAQVFPYTRAQRQAVTAAAPQPGAETPPPAEAASSTGLPAPDGA